jgi:hypothetical protein
MLFSDSALYQQGSYPHSLDLDVRTADSLCGPSLEIWAMFLVVVSAPLRSQL